VLEQPLLTRKRWSDMQYLLLGLLALALVFAGLQLFARANLANLARRIHVLFALAAFSFAGFSTLLGRASLALPMVVIGLILLGRGLLPAYASGPAGHQQSSGKTSSVRTDWLAMDLDHETGEMHGEVLQGTFTGRILETLAPAEVASIWQDCRFADPQSAQLLEAYLDRSHPQWREDFSRMGEDAGAEHSAGSATGGAQQPMTRDEAYAVLGLKPGASTQDIHRAHRELMLKNHPDRGGSTYLATKINQAKELLQG
jgi:hypothetical protein